MTKTMNIPIQCQLCKQWREFGQVHDCSIESGLSGEGFVRAQRLVGPLAKNVERREGAVELLKISISAMNRVLVAKGVCTEDELREAFRAESEKRPNSVLPKQ